MSISTILGICWALGIVITFGVASYSVAQIKDSEKRKQRFDSIGEAFWVFFLVWPMLLAIMAGEHLGTRRRKKLEKNDVHSE